MEEDHTASFISALANLQPVEYDNIASLDGWSVDQLKQEVIRLRRALANVGGVQDLMPVFQPQFVQLPPPNQVAQQSHMQHHTHSHNHGNGPPHHHSPQTSHHHAFPHHQPHSQAHSPHISHQHSMGRGASVTPTQPTPPALPHVALPGYGSPYSQTSRERSGSRKRALSPPRKKRDEGTGKRVEKGRRVELARAIRTKMRYAMNIGLDDDLPPPTALTLPNAPPEVGAWVPNWPAGVSDPHNAQWLDRVCALFITEARNYQVWNKVPPEDLDEDIVKTAARTAFQNFAKRYMAEVDPKHAKKKEKYVKNRRRWARKDLKQKRRAKAAMDPSFGSVLPPSALHIDYMSSEYSSAGEEDGDEQSAHRRGHWLEVLRSQTPEPQKPGKGGWAEGVDQKVLEVRTPTWRSPRLNELYQRLDMISAAQAAMRAQPASHQPTSPGSKPPLRLGHVAPSHKRFTMPNPLMRRGHLPRDLGEGWMWASGVAGVWPERGRSDEFNPSNHHNATNDSATPSSNGMRNMVNVPELEEELDASVDALVQGWTEQ